MKDLESTSYSKHTQVMKPVRKDIFCGLKKYQKDFPNSNILILTTTIVIHFMWTDGIAGNYFKKKDWTLITFTIIHKSCEPEENRYHVDGSVIKEMKDLIINNHFKYT